MAGFDADFFPFDWRTSIPDLGAELADRIRQETASGKRIEHVYLVAMGLGSGIFAAMWAVWPTVRSGPNALLSAALILLVIATNAAFWVWMAVTLSLRGPRLNALRNE